MGFFFFFCFLKQTINQWLISHLGPTFIEVMFEDFPYKRRVFILKGSNFQLDGPTMQFHSSRNFEHGFQRRPVDGLTQRDWARPRRIRPIERGPAEDSDSVKTKASLSLPQPQAQERLGPFFSSPPSVKTVALFPPNVWLLTLYRSKSNNCIIQPNSKKKQSNKKNKKDKK